MGCTQPDQVIALDDMVLLYKCANGNEIMFGRLGSSAGYDQLLQMFGKNAPSRGCVILSWLDLTELMEKDGGDDRRVSVVGLGKHKYQVLNAKDKELQENYMSFEGAVVAAVKAAGGDFTPALGVALRERFQPIIAAFGQSCSRDWIMT